MGSQKVVDEYRIHPGEIKELETGQAVYKAGKDWGKLILPGYFDSVKEIDLKDRIKTAA